MKITIDKSIQSNEIAFCEIEIDKRKYTCPFSLEDKEKTIYFVCRKLNIKNPKEVKIDKIKNVGWKL